jgi:hypothetical protein
MSGVPKAVASDYVLEDLSTTRLDQAKRAPVAVLLARTPALAGGLCYSIAPNAARPRHTPTP